MKQGDLFFGDRFISTICPNLSISPNSALLEILVVSSFVDPFDYTKDLTTYSSIIIISAKTNYPY